MGKFKKFIHFDNKTLESFLDKENTCVKVCNLPKHLILHPYHLSDINESIKEILSAKVARYDQKLEGIFLGYKNAKVTDSANMYDENCYVYIDVNADFFLFKPEVGSVLDGFVVEKTNDHIGALVHDAFNISIPKTEGTWLGNKTKIGYEIRMTVTFTNFEAKLPFIKAELTSIISDKIKNINGEKQVNSIIQFDDEEQEEMETEEIKNNKGENTIVHFLDDEVEKTTLEEAQIQKSSKKKRKRISENLEETPKSSKNEHISFEHKNKKRKRSLSECLNKTEENLSESKKSKKQKKDKDVDLEEMTKLIMMKTLSKVNMNEETVEKPSEKPKKSKKKKKNEDSEIEIEVKKKKRKAKKEHNDSLSLPELNLDKIFGSNDSSCNVNGTFEMADVDDKVTKKRRSSNATKLDIDWENKTLDLPPDSDLDKILSPIKKPKKQKRKSGDIER